jgi:four helix bundle protein
MDSYKDLIVYQKAYRLSLAVYEATSSFPREEVYGLVSQMRRSAVSLPCNIAEGYRRGHRKEYIQFLYMASGSCGELETQLSLSLDLGLIDKASFDTLHRDQDEVSRLLRGLIFSLQRKRVQGKEGGRV